MNDKKIIELYLNRNEKAVKETDLKYNKKLSYISYNIVKNQLDVEECKNDTYLSAWDSIPPNLPYNYLFSYLAKIIRNISLNLYNKNHRQKRITNIVEFSKEIEECIPSPNDELCKIEDEEFIDVINSFLYKLKKEDQNIFIRRYWYFYSIKDIANYYNLSESKVKSTLFRTRNKLRLYLIQEEIEL